MKRRLDVQPEWSARRAYTTELGQFTVAEAAVLPPLTAVERSMQRHKVRNRPPLPATRQDLLLQTAHTTTTDGRRFLLLDDGLADRLLVFGTNENLQR